MQRVLSFCDVCFMRGEEHVATHIAYQINATMCADLCDHHKQELDDSLYQYVQAGRRIEKVSPPKINTPKGTPKPSSVKGTPAATHRHPTVIDGDYPCPVTGCQQQFNTFQGVTMHLTRFHDIPGVARVGQAAHDKAVIAAGERMAEQQAATTTQAEANQATLDRVVEAQRVEASQRTTARAEMSEDAREEERARDRVRKARRREALRALQPADAPTTNHEAETA